jgi:hypothetical protein
MKIRVLKIQIRFSSIIEIFTGSDYELNIIIYSIDFF